MEGVVQYFAPFSILTWSQPLAAGDSTPPPPTPPSFLEEEERRAGWGKLDGIELDKATVERGSGHPGASSRGSQTWRQRGPRGSFFLAEGELRLAHLLWHMR
jgi:hypothetical protein